MDDGMISNWDEAFCINFPMKLWTFEAWNLNGCTKCDFHETLAMCTTLFLHPISPDIFLATSKTPITNPNNRYFYIRQSKSLHILVGSQAHVSVVFMSNTFYNLSWGYYSKSNGVWGIRWLWRIPQGWGLVQIQWKSLMLTRFHLHLKYKIKGLI